jgi:Raf kinase inhibitor-like YbhB/YbcL family protein
MKAVLALAVTAVLALSGCDGSSGTEPSPAAAPPPARSATGSAGLRVTSDAFTDGGRIPAAYTCTGGGQVPALDWSGNLGEATALAVVVDDPDAPGRTFVHRVVVDLPVTASSLGADPPPGAHEAKNSAGRTGWTPPCPPSGTHHYRFTVYGLRSPTGLPDGVAAADAIQAINARVLVQGRLVGLVSHS